MKNTREVALQVPKAINTDALLEEARHLTRHSHITVVPVPLFERLIISWRLMLKRRSIVVPWVAHLRVQYPELMSPVEVDDEHAYLVRSLARFCGHG